MIIEKTQEIVETVGLQKSNTFSISCNQEMFEMLSSGVYKDKIKAVIRELSTNALDAHIDAGVTRNFKVQLPTTLEPTFSVRDYGHGMSEEDIMVLYSSYGESTKRLSNAFNGALGIGSKSPFSYSQAFSVISRHEGKAKTYALYVDNGMPTVSKTGESDLEDPEDTGLEVLVPVEADDFYTFNTTATKVYQWFSTRPDINIELADDFKELRADLTGTDWKLYDDREASYYEKMGGIHVVMANVCYPVDVAGLDSKIRSTIGKSDILIEVPTGSVRMAASRESLSMTTETIAYLNKRLAEISDELVVVLKAKIDDEGDMTVWNKRIFLQQLKDDYSLTDLINENFTEGEESIKAYLRSTIEVVYYPRYGRSSSESSSIIVYPKASTLVIKMEKGYKNVKSRARNASANGASYLLCKPVGVSWEDFNLAADQLQKDIGGPTLTSLEDIGCYKTEKRVHQKRDPNDKSERVKLADKYVSLTALREGYGTSSSKKASEIAQDDNIKKVVYFPATNQYLSDSNWAPFETEGPYSNRGYKNYKATEAISTLALFMMASPHLFSEYQGAGIEFCVISKSDKALLKWSDKFVSVHDFVKGLKVVPMKVIHKDVHEFADFINVAITFEGYNDVAINLDATFRDLRDWVKSNGLLVEKDYKGQLLKVRKLFPMIAIKTKAIRPRGFCLNRLKTKYALWSHIRDYEGKVTFLKTVTKTYSKEDSKTKVF